jgi:hypothetical protein
MVEEEPGQPIIKVIITQCGTVTRVENEEGTWGDSQHGMGANRAITRAQKFLERNPGYTLKVVDLSNTL